jgi:membrane carboxypeptidase/penicillin-binding protein
MKITKTLLVIAIILCVIALGFATQLAIQQTNDLNTLKENMNYVLKHNSELYCTSKGWEPVGTRHGEWC